PILIVPAIDLHIAERLVVVELVGRGRAQVVELRRDDLNAFEAFSLLAFEIGHEREREPDLPGEETSEREGASIDVEDIDRREEERHGQERDRHLDAKREAFDRERRRELRSIRVPIRGILREASLHDAREVTWHRLADLADLLGRAELVDVLPLDEVELVLGGIVGRLSRK